MFETANPLRHKIFTGVVGATISLITAFPAPAQSNLICPAQLQQEVEKIVQSPKLSPSRVGVFVQTTEANPQVLSDVDGDRYFVPASNIKLFTTAVALKVLGADYRFTTRLVSQTLPNAQGELENGLWILASGDPSFSSATSLKSLVAQLKSQGVKRINRGIWASSSLKGTEIAGSWEWDDLQHYYAAIASPFTIDENILEWNLRPTSVGELAKFEWNKPMYASTWQVNNQVITASAVDQGSGKSLTNNDVVIKRSYPDKLLLIRGQIAENAQPKIGEVTVPNPKENFLRLLRQELTAQGISVEEFDATSQNTFDDSVPYQNLGSHSSSPLSDLLVTANKDSSNLYAELMIRAIGERSKEAESEDNFNTGLDQISKYLQSINIAPDHVLPADGSGLSRHNLTTPRAIAQILNHMVKDTYFRNSLAIAGVNGTLINRFKDNVADGLIRAKTGTLTGTTALSGYATPANHPEVVFSILINNSNLQNTELQQYSDAIALLLTRLTKCP